ncbi:MAG: hypothetical protein ACW98Y_01400 [Candidatus Thorarchaeota archaeon]|jgi:hypothetical protein
MPDSSNEVDEIHQIIDNMQARLVELFDQLRELRTRLDQRTMPTNHESVLPLFSKITESEEPPETTSSSMERNETTTEASDIPPETPADAERPTTEPSAPSEVRVSRFLDPITHELKTGNSPAEVIAEYLQAAKDELITSSTSNEKVERDMDIVLKFLRARGRRGIRDEERDNILRRIKRWQAHLGKS